MGNERPEGEVVERLTQQTCTFPAHIDRDGVGWSKFRMADVQFVLGELERLKSRALAAEARVEGLVEGLIQAAVWFEEYADHHQAKAALDKASRNLERANHLRRAASLVGGEETGSSGVLVPCPKEDTEAQHSAGWRHVIQCDFDRHFAADEWLIVASDEPRVTVAKPFDSGAQRFWVCGTGPNLSDPRWPCEYLPFKVVAWMRAPRHPAENGASLSSEARASVAAHDESNPTPPGDGG